MRRLAFFAASLVFVACIDSGFRTDAEQHGPSGTSGLGMRNARDQPMDAPSIACETSDNAIDHAVCPRLYASGCGAAPVAPTYELCRRMHLDLTGVVASQDELVSTCAGKTPRQIAVALMASPLFVRHAKELWGEALGYEPAQVDGKWLADADQIVASLVTGEIGYDAFAKRILGHPLFGVGARLPRSDQLTDDDGFFPQSGRRAIKVFLGREAIAGEDVALAKLFSPWKKKIVVLNGDYGRAEPFLDPAACPCKTSLFGQSTELRIPLGTHMMWDDLAPDVPPALRAELDKVGALFVSQPAFWAQGADLALGMYLGWWKTTLAQDQSLLPEVELALGETLRTEPAHSFRELILSVVTSALYTRSNVAPASAAAESPVWCTGPLRVLRPEAYVASLGKVLGVRVGRCDHRTYEALGVFYADGSEGSFFPNALREDEASDGDVLGTTDYHYRASTQMGGCSGGAARSEDPTLPMVFGASPIAATLCAKSQVLLPDAVGAADSSPATMEAVIDRVFERMVGRLPTNDESAAIAADVALCTGPSCGAGALATNVCAALARSSEFSTY